jgi:succinoglycan biosynthesis transport protein ExoP
MTGPRATNRKLLERGGALHRHWPWIVAGGSACAAGALIVSLFLPSVYRATTYLLISESRIGEPARDTNLQQMAMLPTFIPFVDNDALIEESLKKLKLDQPPYNLTLDLFRRRNYLDVRAPKSTRLLELNIEFPDARLAADLANEVAQGAVQYNQRLNISDTVSTQEFLRKQLDRALEAQTEAASQRLRALEEARIEDREKELSILLAEKDHLSTQLQQLRLDLVQNQGRTKSLEKALADEPELISLKRSVTSDRFVELAAEKAFPDGTPLVVTEESVNKVREEMRQTFVSASVNGAAQAAGIAAATARLNQVNKEISELISRITALRGRIEAAGQAYLLAVETTKTASRDYQAASVTVSSKSQDMKQIAPALVPQRPVRPRILINTLLGFVLGILLFAGAVIAMRSFREVRSPEELRTMEHQPWEAQQSPLLSRGGVDATSRKTARSDL